MTESTHPDPILGTFFNTLTAKPLEWLWPDRIPLGHLTLLDSPPGLGASRLAIDLAASVTSGHPLPDGKPCTQGNVILIAPNDHPTSTILPRLQAAGADLAHILLLNTVPDLDPVTHTTIQRPLALPDDFALLEAAITDTGARLLIIDPLATVFTPSRSRATRPWTRRPYTALAQLAQRTNCAILLIRTLGKPPTSPTLQSNAPGGLPLLCAARSVLLLFADPGDKHLSYLVSAKHSLSHEPPTLSYQRSTTTDGLPTILWLGESELPSPETAEQSNPLSLQRQDVLRICRTYPHPVGPKALAGDLFQPEEATRKLLQRMLHAGQLTQPAYGLYTTPDHPCLADSATSSPSSASDSPVPPVPLTQQDPIFPGGYLPTYLPVPLSSQDSFASASDSPVPPVPPTQQDPFTRAWQTPGSLLTPLQLDQVLAKLEEMTHLPIRHSLPAYTPPPVTPVPLAPDLSDLPLTQAQFGLLFTDLEEATHLPIYQRLEAFDPPVDA